MAQEPLEGSCKNSSPASDARRSPAGGQSSQLFRFVEDVRQSPVQPMDLAVHVADFLKKI